MLLLLVLIDAQTLYNLYWAVISESNHKSSLFTCLLLTLYSQDENVERETATGREKKMHKK